MKTAKHQKKGCKKESKRGKTVGKHVPSKEELNQMKDLASLVYKHYGFKPNSVKQLRGGYESKNYMVDYEGQQFILKLQQSRNLNHLRDNLKFRTDILKELEHRKDQPRLDYPRVVQSPQGQVMFENKVKKCYITMLRFIPGRNLYRDETYPLRNSLMNALGIFQRDLAKVQIQGKKKQKRGEWQPISNQLTRLITENMLSTIPTQKTTEKMPIKTITKIPTKIIEKKQINASKFVTDSQKASQALSDNKIYLNQFIESYRDFGRNHFKNIKLSISHCDLHNGNILTNKQGSKVTGIIDFGWSLSYQHFYEDFKYLFRSVIGAIPNLTLRPSAALNDICEMVYQYHRYCPLNLEGLDVECLYFIIGKMLLEFNRKNGQLRHSKVSAAYRNTLLLLFLKVPPKQFIANLKEGCLRIQSHVEKKQFLPTIKQQSKKEEQLLHEFQRTPFKEKQSLLNQRQETKEGLSLSKFEKTPTIKQQFLTNQQRNKEEYLLSEFQKASLMKIYEKLGQKTKFEEQQ